MAQDELEDLGDLEPIDVVDPTAGLGRDLRAQMGFEAVRSGANVRAREIAEQILIENPDDFTGHALLGMAQHRGEGNLPRAYFHLQRALELFEGEHSATPDNSAPWFWHGAVLGELAQVAGEMGRHQEKLHFLARHDESYQPEWPADRAWPLMRLRRYEEARMAALEGLMRVDQPDQIATARTALCAIEAELHNRQASFDACIEALQFDRESAFGGPAVYTNAAESALGVLRFDLAERYILEGTGRFARGTVSNPWMDLTLLYLAEGRTSEALDSFRRMFTWRRRQPAFMDEQNRAEAEMTAAIFMLVAGRADAAAKITARALERPDRTGFTSSESEQMEAAAALLDAVAHRLAAELADEEASWAEFGPAAKVRLGAWRHRLRAWTSARRAASLLADDRMLVATMRPYLAGSVEVPEWLEPELVEVLGAGVVSAALDRARTVEDLEGAAGYFDAQATEVAYHQGRWRKALDASDLALAALPSSELLLRARVAAIGAEAARRVGQASRALELFDLAMQADPGTVRRLGLRLPAVFRTDDSPLARRAGTLLRRSPRFRPASAGFAVEIEGDGAGGRACLLGPQDSVLTCAEVRPRAGDDADSLPRRLAAELHRQAFAPRVDLTQSDLDTLDGSPIAAGGRSAERLNRVLSGLVGE